MIILIFKPSGSMELKLFTLCERCCLPLQPHPTPTPSSWFSTLSPSASRLHPAKVFPSPGAQFQVSPHPLDLPEIAPPRPTRYCLSRHPMCFLCSTYHDLQLSYLSAPSWILRSLSQTKDFVKIGIVSVLFTTRVPPFSPMPGSQEGNLRAIHILQRNKKTSYSLAADGWTQAERTYNMLKHTFTQKPLVGEWVNELWNSHRMGYYSLIKRNELSNHKKTWINLKGTFLSERINLKRLHNIWFQCISFLGLQ